jgi:hypothetical protein
MEIPAPSFPDRRSLSFVFGLRFFTIFLYIRQQYSEMIKKPRKGSHTGWWDALQGF